MGKNKNKKKNKDKNKVIRLFVYGTLQTGGMLASGLDDLRISSEPATTRGLLFHNWRWPMLTPTSLSADIVHGEAHEYPKHALEIMDSIEGYFEKDERRSLFVRKQIPVFADSNKGDRPEYMYAYIWPWSVSGYANIFNGEWKDSMASNKQLS